MGRTTAVVIQALTSTVLAIGACALIAGCPPKPPTVSPQPLECRQWEYKVQYSLPTPRPERKGDDAAKATSVTPSADELAALGKEGWELAGLVLEDETAYPQFDKVAVPNVRPQRLVLFFKRQSCQK